MNGFTSIHGVEYETDFFDGGLDRCGDSHESPALDLPNNLHPKLRLRLWVLTPNHGYKHFVYR